MKFTVSGTAQALVSPDEALVSLIVTSEGPEQAAALDDVKSALAGLQRLAEAFVEDEGPAKDWHVSGLNTHSWRPHDDRGKELPVRFSATASAGLTFSDHDAMSSFVDQAGRQQSVSVSHISWSLSTTQQEGEHHRLLPQALEAAHTKAKLLAAASGQSELELYSVVEDGAESHSFEQGAPRMAMAAYGGPPESPELELLPAPTVVKARLTAQYRTPRIPGSSDERCHQSAQQP